MAATKPLDKDQLLALKQLVENAEKVEAAAKQLEEGANAKKSKATPITLATAALALLGSVATFMNTLAEEKQQNNKVESTYNILATYQQEQNAMVRERLARLEERLEMVHNATEPAAMMASPGDGDGDGAEEWVPECESDPDCPEATLCENGECVEAVTHEAVKEEKPRPAPPPHPDDWKSPELPTFKQIEQHVQQANAPYPAGL